MEHLDQLEQQDHKVLPELMEQLELKGHREFRDLPELMVLMV
jgi:hypothetical protein